MLIFAHSESMHLDMISSTVFLSGILCAMLIRPSRACDSNCSRNKNSNSNNSIRNINIKSTSNQGSDSNTAARYGPCMAVRSVERS